MEFRKFLKLLGKNRKRLFFYWGSIVLIGMVIVALLPEKKVAVLSIDIARESQEQNDALYEYDQFYRLEADDRFANTLVQWCKDPNTKRTISGALEGKLSKEDSKAILKTVRAEKKSANLVQVIYEVDENAEAPIFAKALFEVFTNKTNALNGDQEQGWFKIIGSGPTVEEKSLPLLLMFVIFIIAGLIVSLFAVVVTYYFNEEDIKDENWN